MEVAATRSRNQTRKNQSTATTTEVETTGTEEASGSSTSSQTKSSNIYNNSLITKQQSARYNFMLCVEMGEKRTQKENHINRLQNLRKELNYIKTTDWQYEPIEKYIGQAS